MEQRKSKSKLLVIFAGIMAGITALTCFLSVKNTYANTGEDEPKYLIISSSEEMPKTEKYVESDFEFGEDGQTLSGKFLRIYQTVPLKSNVIISSDKGNFAIGNITSAINVDFSEAGKVTVTVCYCGSIADLTSGKGIIVGNVRNEIGAEGNYVDIYVNPGSEYMSSLGTLKLDERAYKDISNGSIKVLTEPEVGIEDTENSFNLGEWLNGAGDTVSEFLQSNLGVSVSGTVCIIAIAIIIVSMLKRKR